MKILAYLTGQRRDVSVELLNTYKNLVDKYSLKEHNNIVV